jgi:TolB-like protein/DNA-binding CsgD family transcriptional regulator/Tfp pilus assembly protein PilF
MGSQRQASLEDLSPRQRQVFGLMARGLTNVEIARTLGVQSATVKTHVSRILSLLDVSSRTEAVGVYNRSEGAPAAVAAPAASHAFDDRPTVAVMPFALLGEGETVARLGLALTEDLTQRLAMWRLFPVLARCATWSYLGKAWEASEVSERLGAQYLVEGSVQPASGGVRVSVNLVDGETLAHLWGDHYVVGGPDLIHAQVETSDSIVAALYPKLIQAEFDRHIPRDPADLGAWELALLGLNYLNHPVQSREHSEKARGLFREAEVLDPEFVVPHFGLLFSNYFDLIYQRGDSPAAVVATMQMAAEKAEAVDPKHPHALLCKGVTQALRGEWSSTKRAFSEALAGNPCDRHILETYGTFLATREGEYDEGLLLLERAERLAAGSARAFTAQACMVGAHMAAGKPELALEAAEKAALNAPNDVWVCHVLASARAYAGQIDAARAAVERLRLLRPDFDAEQVKLQTRALATPEIAEAVIESLERAGF